MLLTLLCSCNSKGAVEASQSFDTHGDSSAQRRMKSFVDGLANGYEISLNCRKVGP